MQETTFFFNLEEIMAISYAKQHVGGCCLFSKVRPYVHYFSDNVLTVRVRYFALH